MSDNQNLQNKFEKEQITEQTEKRSGQIEQPSQEIEKKEELEVSPADKQEVLDEIKRFEKQKKGSLISVSNIALQQKKRKKKIEKILEKGLEDIYSDMPAGQQKEFKLRGEETVQKINTLLDKAKIKVKKIISLIKKWLSIIPGVNKFFLEQEAKIKADEILKLNNK